MKKEKMKKKKTIWTYVKRVVLITILAVIAICLSVFFLGKYKASGTEFVNEYPDQFWDQLDGFVHSDQIKENLTNEINSQDVKHSKYTLPFNTNEVTDPIEMCKFARHKDELEYIKDNFAAALVEEADKKAFEAECKIIKDALPSWKKYQESLSKKVVLSNENFEMTMNVLDTTFELKDLKTGNVWASNPEEDVLDDGLGIQKIQKSILNLTYINSDKAATPIPNVMSSYFDSTREDAQSRRTSDYYLKFDAENKKVFVYYVYSAGGIDYTSFPAKITGARLAELMNRCNELAKKASDEAKESGAGRDGLIYDTNIRGNKRAICGFGPNIQFLNNNSTNLKPDRDTIVDPNYLYTKYDYYYAKELMILLHNLYQAYQIDEATGQPTFYDGNNRYYGGADYYEYNGKIENISKSNLQVLYRFFYDWCQYTEEDLAIDNGGAKAVSGKPELKAAIVYSLTDQGLQVDVPGNSVRANSDNYGNEYHVVSIDVLPYFTSSKLAANTGYVVIPDGSGAIMEFDNGKANYSAYSKRIYSSDLAFTSYTITSQTTEVLLPMYSYVYTKANKEVAKTNTAIFAEATKGASQMAINAYASGQAGGANSFNYTYFSIAYRESQQVVFGTSNFNRVNIKQFSQKAATGDYQIKYDFLSTKEAEKIDYSYVAKYYQKIIASRNPLVSVNGDQTDHTMLNLEVIGQYSFNDNFLGIQFDGKDTLTTIEQLAEIIHKILENNATTGINVYYKGWRKEGLKNTSFKNIKVSNKIGGRKELLNFINAMKEKNINIYPEVEFLEYDKYQESFGNNHYTSRDIGGSYATKKKYDLNTGIYSKTGDSIMTLSPNYYYAFANNLAKNYSKVLKGIDTIALTGLGSQLSGSYKRNKEVFKYTALEEQIKAFKLLEEQGINKIALEAPYEYAIGYASNAYNVPTETSKQEILDYAVPFYQLVMNGMFDYSGISINEQSEKSIMEHIMKCIEIGSNPSFTFTYDETSKLVQTDYNNYYYTFYERWMDDVKKTCDELNGIKIYECNLLKHERLDDNVFKVTYQNKTDATKQIEIVLNYQRIPWSDTVNGLPIDVEAKSYKVLSTYEK